MRPTAFLSGDRISGPSYLKIPDFVEQLPVRPVVSAFTATATAEVREDIAAILGLQDPVTLVTGFDRKNLRFSVKQPADKMAATLAYIMEHPDECGIIYCLTTKDCGGGTQCPGGPWLFGHPLSCGLKR